MVSEEQRPSTLVTVSLTHRSSPLAELERVAVSASERTRVQSEALAAGCAEVMVLSTCSRVELLAVLDMPGGPVGRRHLRCVTEELVDLLAPDGQCEAVEASVICGDDAIRHLFRVASGLDSRIVGETEVQAQLRVAARSAAAAQGEPHRLGRMVTAAVSAARCSSRSHPDLLRGGLLVQRAVSLVVGDDERTAPLEALVLGTGTMGRQVLEALRPTRARTILMSRRSSTAKGGCPTVHPLEDLPERLPVADVVFVATSAGRQLLSVELVEHILERGPLRGLTIVDLSLPRNVDPAVREIPGVRLLDLDELGDRARGVMPDPWEVRAVEAATRAAAEAFLAEIRSRRAGPTINSLRTGVESTALEQLRRTARGLGLSEEMLRRMASAVAGAVAHEPTRLARAAAAENDEQSLALIRAAFGLAEGSGQQAVRQLGGRPSSPGRSLDASGWAPAAGDS